MSRKEQVMRAVMMNVFYQQSKYERHALEHECEQGLVLVRSCEIRKRMITV